MAVAPVRLLTIEEYAALGETEIGYTKLVESRMASTWPCSWRPSANPASRAGPTC